MQSVLTMTYLGMVMVCVTPNVEMGVTIGAMSIGFWCALAKRKVLTCCKANTMYTPACPVSVADLPKGLLACCPVINQIERVFTDLQPNRTSLHRPS